MRPSPYFWPALVQYFRERTRLWAAAGLWGGSLLLAFNLYAAVATYIPQYQVRNDFRLIYGAALNGWQNGYGHLYDLAAQKAVVEGLGWGTYWSPYLNPPTLAWIATPFLAMPFEAALFLWTLLIAGAALLAWRLVAPGSGLTRAAHLALFLGLFPTAFGLMVGQPVALVAAAVAVAWGLASHNGPVVGGLAFSRVAIKPQVARLVPPSLPVAGHRRMFAAWVSATAGMG